MNHPLPKGLAQLSVMVGLVFLPACAGPDAGFELPQSPGEKTPAARAPLAGFLDIKAPVAGQLSPDGTLYYMNRAGQAYQLFRRDSQPGSEPVRVSSFEDGVAGFTLSPDGKQVVILAGRGGDEQLDLFLMPTETLNIRPLMVDRSVVYSSVVWKRDSSGFAFRANDRSPRDFHVYAYDLASARTELVLAAEGSNSPADFSRDGSKLIIGKYNSNSYQQVFEVDLTSGSLREVTPRGVQRQFTVIGYNADDTGLIVATDYLDNFTNLALLDLETSEVSPLAPEFDRHDLDTAELNEDRSILAAVINDEGYGRLILKRLGDMSSISAPRMGKGMIHGLRFTGQTLLFSFHCSQSPGTIISWNMARPNSPPLALTVPHDGGIDLRTFVLPKLVSYESFDGLRIPAFLYLPRDHKKGAPRPFVLAFHGGPEGQARPRLQPIMQYFLSRGFGVLQPNVRGSSGYGTKYMNLDNYQRRMDSVRDGLAAAQWLIDQGYAAKGRIGVFGGSYGGFMVMAAITEAPDLFGAACDYVGIVNFETFLKNTKDYRRHLREAEYGPLSDPEFLRGISPIHKVDRIRTPLLVVHGRNDPRVPVGEARQIVAALRERGGVVESVIFEDEGHGVRKQPNRIRFYEALVSFFEKHLKS